MFPRTFFLNWESIHLVYKYEVSCEKVCPHLEPMGWVPILRPLVCSTRTFRHLSFAEGNTRRTWSCSKLRRHVAECPGDPRRLVERGARHRPGGDRRGRSPPGGARLAFAPFQRLCLGRAFVSVGQRSQGTSVCRHRLRGAQACP